MKRFLFFFVLLCPTAHAQTTTPGVSITPPSVTMNAQATTTTPSPSSLPQIQPNSGVTPANNPAPPKYSVINGQKFFSMQNARRHNGQGLSPSAMSVLHHPRSGPGTRNTAHPTPNRNNDDGSSKKKNNDVLSLFPSSTPPPTPMAPPSQPAPGTTR